MIVPEQPHVHTPVLNVYGDRWVCADNDCGHFMGWLGDHDMPDEEVIRDGPD